MKTFVSYNSGLKPKLFLLNHQLLLSFRNTPENYFALKIKCTIDFFLSILTLIVLSPGILLIGLLIKLEDGGPVLFKQVRVGRHGREFKCLKFRTIVVDAEGMKQKLMALNEQDGSVFRSEMTQELPESADFCVKLQLMNCLSLSTYF